MSDRRMSSDLFMARLHDIGQQIGYERVLRELEDAGLIVWDGVTEDGSPLFSWVLSDDQEDGR